MEFRECLHRHQAVLMEGALGERLKREYHIKFDEHVAMAGLIYNLRGMKALVGDCRYQNLGRMLRNRPQTYEASCRKIECET